MTAIGGGHGLAVTLRAVRRLTPLVTAVVTVADDGGSTGRLRAAMGLPGVGDLRKCLRALSPDDSRLASMLDHRFDDGELAGHAFGNLLIAALVRTSPDLVDALDEAGRLCDATGRVLPATVAPVTLVAHTRAGDMVRGQVAIMATSGIERVTLEPVSAEAPKEALDAIVDSDLVVIGPGSLYTSVLAAVMSPGVVAALRETAAKKVFVCNLAPQPPETEGYDAAAHVAALVDHGVQPDLVLCAENGLDGADRLAGAVVAPLSQRGGRVHDPVRLADALAEVIAPIGGAAATSGRIVAN